MSDIIMALERIIYISCKEHTLNSINGNILECDNNLSIIRALGQKDDKKVEYVSTFDMTEGKNADWNNDVFNKLICYIEESVEEHRENDDSWMNTNVQESKCEILLEKSYFVEVWAAKINEANEIEVKKGNYTLNQVRASLHNRLSFDFVCNSTGPIFIENKKKIISDLNKSVLQMNHAVFRLSAIFVLSILYQILPSFYDDNININQSWIHDNYDDIALGTVSLSVKYPNDYMDLDGNINKGSKCIIDNGAIINCIGAGDKIVLNKELGIGVDAFSIIFDCINTCNFSNMVLVDEHSSNIIIDVVNGSISGTLVGLMDDTVIEKQLLLSITQFMSSLEACSEKKQIGDNIVCDVILTV